MSTPSPASPNLPKGEPAHRGAPAVPNRHPLGLPAGSVRALLAFLVLALIWTLMLLPRDPFVPIPLYLYYLMFLILGHFYAAHGHSIAGPQTGTRSPLYLPRGTLRLLIILGFAAVLGWRQYTQRDWKEIVPALPEQPWLPLVLLVAFFLGILVSRLIGAMFSRTGGTPYWYQDIQAWLALVAMLLLSAEVLIQAVINPTLAPERQLQLPQMQAVLTAIVGFYFGARS